MQEEKRFLSVVLEGYGIYPYGGELLRAYSSAELILSA